MSENPRNTIILAEKKAPAASPQTSPSLLHVRKSQERHCGKQKNAVILHYPILSYIILYYPILSYIIIDYHILSYIIRYYQALRVMASNGCVGSLGEKKQTTQINSIE